MKKISKGNLGTKIILALLVSLSLVAWFGGEHNRLVACFGGDHDEVIRAGNHPETLAHSSRDTSATKIDCQPHLGGQGGRIVADNSIRFTEQSMVKYLVEKQKIAGWLDDIDIYLMGYLSRVQHELNITGSVGEIGVHHGKVTIPIALFAAKSERIWAADLFEHNQKENVDRSGGGNEQKFIAHLEEYGLVGEEDAPYIQTINSLKLDYSDLAARNFSSFRFLSIDGGHTHETTLNDLIFACDIVMDGSIISVDDFPRPDWLGVASGLFAFVNGQSFLQPFLFSRNKAYLTTQNYGDKYIDSLESMGMNCKRNGRANQLQRSGIFTSNFCALDCGTDKSCGGIATLESTKKLVSASWHTKV